MRKITTQERAAIIAGLRLLQETIGENSGNLPEGIEEIFTNGYTIDVEDQLTLEDIDRLCEEINVAETAPVLEAIKTRPQIEEKLHSLLKRVNNEEPTEICDHLEAQKWYGVHCEIDVLNWILAVEVSDGN